MSGYLLFAQATESAQFKFFYLLAVFAIGIVLPIFIGRFIAQRVRMQDYGWRIGLILCSLTMACLVIGRSWDSEAGRFDIPLGVDLKGGVILIYEVDKEATVAAEEEQADSTGSDADPDNARISMGALVEALARRINPSGTKEIVIRPYGDQQVEVIVPEVDQVEVEKIKELLSKAGMLEFRIVANQRKHSDVIAAARDQAAEADPLKRRARFIRDDAGDKIGLWAQVGREAREGGGGTFKVLVSSSTLRNPATGEILDVPVDHMSDDEQQFTAYIASLGIDEIEVLMAINDGFDVTGGHLGAVSQGTDEVLRPCIHFNLKGAGVGLFAGLTRTFGPEGSFEHRLGILLDNTLLSAPNIQEPITQGRGRITGQFTREEVEFVVNILEAGSLPVVLNPNPISENQINPLLGEATIEQGRFAIGISLGLVLVFILLYYRFSGVVACLALVANLLFIVALMILIKAAFTLPGLAGLVLTVGMSVDANVLIFERIREELSRGAALRMAIRNGFGRATTTIVDANVTTLITALVLYGIGTDQIRGFAVTLILGILMSMFTAIFCSRVIFDIAERTRVLSRLRMMQLLSATQIDFLGKRQLAGVFSLLVIAIGIAGIASRRADMFDIDFRGGTSVHVVFSEPQETEAVRAPLSKAFEKDRIRFTLTAMNNTAGQTKNEIFKVDTSIAEVEDLQQTIQQAFADPSAGMQLATYQVSYGDFRVVETPSEIVTEDATPASGEATESNESAADNEDEPKADGDEAASPASGTDEPQEKQDAADDAPSDDAPSSEAASSDTPAADAPTDDADGQGEAEPKSDEGARRDLPSDSLIALAQPAEADAEQPAATEATEDSAEQPAESETPASTDEAAADEQPKEEPADPDAEPAGDTEPSAAASEPADDAPTEASTEAESTEAESTEAESTEAESTPATESEGEGSGEAAPVAPESTSHLEVDLTFEQSINEATLRDEINKVAEQLEIPEPYFLLDNPEWDGGSNAFDAWTMRISAEEEDARKILDGLEDRFAGTPVWASSSKIGGQVAEKMQQRAIAALLASLFGIVVYIWIRFQRVIFGLAAVVALLHDVAVTLGAIAVSAWLADALGFLLIEEFKISLPIVAALLTIIGYSLNDTIVVFDRIREVRGKSPELTKDMINTSINQTLGRTLLTSFTTLLVVVILYAIGGEGIHGFAYALVVGVTVGTYSSIFVASPVLLWMTGLSAKTKAA